jgi:hypothetical protein
MNENLMTIVLEALAFFDLAGAELIDPDAAAEQTEGAVRTLSQFSTDEKKEFAAFARRYAADEESTKGPPERVDFFRSVPENFELEG